MNPFTEWLRAHAPLLQQINKGVRSGLVPPGFDLLQDAAKKFGKQQGDALQAIGANVGTMPRAQDYKNADDYSKAQREYAERFVHAYTNVAATVGSGEGGRAPDQIASPALKLPRGATVDGKTILTGRSHPNILFDNALESKLSSKQLEGVKDGFVTMDGKFVSRKKATSIANKAGQLTPTGADEIAEYGGELHSGDFHPPKESPLSAAVGRARDRMHEAFGLNTPLMPNESLGDQQAAEIFNSGKSTPFPYQQPFREVAPDRFHEALSAFADARPDEKGFITWRTPEEMKEEGMKTYLSPDRRTGYAIHTASGDIRNVFNHGTQGEGAKAVAHALANGGKVLDHFDTNLGNFYRDFGFKETSRAPWNAAYAPETWNAEKYGKPDFVVQQHPQAGQLTPDQYLAQYEANRAARKENWLQPHIEAPSVITPPERWKPTPRGVFDRNAPKIQGQIPSDPRLTPPQRNNVRYTSPFVDAVMDSKTVRNGLDSDVDKGLLTGAGEWYELGPIKADLDSRAGTGAMSFSDFNSTGSAASASNSVPNEISAGTIVNYARKHGLTREQAVQHFLDATRSPTKTPLMGMHMQGGLRAIENGGTILPTDPLSEAWKIPMYGDKRAGGGGILDVNAPGGMPALDAKERMRIMQFAMQDPQLAKFARELGEDEASRKLGGMIPIRNVDDYKALSGLYVDGAKRYGLPTAGAYQAPRWTGGWKETNLKSPPTGDYLQILEDAILYTAQRRGLDPSPAGLRRLWGRIAQSEDFILPWSKAGYYPLK